MKGYTIYIVLFVAALVSCGKEEVPDPYVPIDELSATNTVLIPDKETKHVSTTLQFNNLSDIDYLLVNKSGGAAYTETIERSELTPSYRFNYAIQSSDPESFRLLLKAVYTDGNISNELVLNVDNRWGFFIRSVERVARVTGSPMIGEIFPSPNNTGPRWNVGGTDLGIIWEMSQGRYGIFFGDTFGNDFRPNTANPGPNGSNWRSNVLGFSSDTELDDGLTIDEMASGAGSVAREIVYSAKTGNDVTSIPTAAIRADKADYVHYFNMRNWDTWTTNYSGMYKSIDNGQSWEKLEEVTFSSHSPFGQAGYFKKEGYVYMIGTETGRNGQAYLARFFESNIENRENYEYWNGTSGAWVRGNEQLATVIIDDKVGELSFIYNEKLEKWIIAYFNGDRYNITMRTAEQLTGPWSEPYELASGWEYAQLYGSYFHPLSVHGEELYFTMSMWLPYNVFLMKAVLADMGDF